LAFQNHRSLRYRTQGVIMLSRARYSWPGSNYPVMLDDCSAGPPPRAASAAEASLPDPMATRASFLSGVSPLPGSRPRLSMYAAPDMGPFSGAYAAGFVSLAEKSSLEKTWVHLLSQNHLILHDLFSSFFDENIIWLFFLMTVITPRLPAPALYRKPSLH